jgi:Domain of unknown function (DUF4145)
MSVENTDGSKPNPDHSPQDALVECAQSALTVAKTARKNGKPLNGANFYASKMTKLQADAALALKRFPTVDSAKHAKLAALVGSILSKECVSSTDRCKATDELQFLLRTEWTNVKADNGHVEQKGVFPLSLIEKTGRKYLVTVCRQINGCYASGWYDACAVMMRRLLETSIIMAFESRKIDNKVKEPGTGDFFQLTRLIDTALAEPSWNLPRTVRKKLPELRDLGHRSAHNRYFVTQEENISVLIGAYQETVQTFLCLANLI